MPDAVAVVTGYLRSALAAVGEPVLVVSRIPPPRPARFVRVERVGGTRQTVVSDRPRLDFHAWGETEADAADLAELVRALVHVIPGVRSGVTVYSAREVGGLQWLPDQDSGISRYAFRR
ncbi:phage protein [Streptomyces venezuelae]|nr:phage protein [Streptomyces venezuelae]